MEDVLQSITNSAGAQIEKLSYPMRDEANEIKADDSSKVHEGQNNGRVVATGFHGDDC